MSYLLWIPVLLLYMYGYAYISNLHNTTDFHIGPITGFYVLWIYGAAPFWAFVSKISKNLTFDALLFELLSVIAFVVSLTIIQQKGLSAMQGFGLALISIGLILFEKS